VRNPFNGIERAQVRERLQVDTGIRIHSMELKVYSLQSLLHLLRCFKNPFNGIES